MSEGTFYYGEQRLENDLVVLEPFDPRFHAAKWPEVVKTRPDVFAYLSFPIIETEADFLREFYDPLRTSPQDCLYAIIDKTHTSEGNPEGKYAGIASLTASNPNNATVDMGAIVFPEFQRTHVTTNVIGLLLMYILDPPSAGGLGLRRVEWRCHAGNAASRRVASRMCFELEGILRWQCVLPHGKIALPVEALEMRNGTKGEQPGRHSAVFSVVWDEWDEKRPKVIAQMKRKQSS